jgi:hypothetical protein
MSVSGSDPVRAVVIDARPLGGDDDYGNPLFVVDLTVLEGDRAPVRARVSVGVPSHAIRQLHPGAELPAELVHTGGGPVSVLRFGDLAEAPSTAVADPAPSARISKEYS